MDAGIYALLLTKSVMGGICAFILDTCIPGSKTERGLFRWHRLFRRRRSEKTTDIYDLPFVPRRHWQTYLPFMPAFFAENMRLRNILEHRRDTRHSTPGLHSRRRSETSGSTDHSRSMMSRSTYSGYTTVTTTTRSTRDDSTRDRMSLGGKSDITGWYNREVRR